MNKDIKSAINFMEISDMIKKKWLFIMTITLLATITTGVLSFYVIEPKYQTAVKVFVGKEENNEDGYSSSDIQMYQKLLKTYSEAIRTTDLIERSIDGSRYDLSIKGVLDSLTVVPVADTQILEVSYISKDPGETQDTLNRIVEEFISISKDLVPNGSVTVIQKVRLPEEPISPNKTMNIAIAFVLGFMASVGLVILKVYMNNTYSSKSQLEKELNIPIIGVIPEEDLK